MVPRKKTNLIVSIMVSACCALLGLSLSTSSMSQNTVQAPNPNVKKGTIIRVALLDSTPWSYYENNIPTGIDYDILQLVAKELGIKLEINLMPFRRRLVLISSGEADLMTAAVPVNDTALYPQLLHVNKPPLYQFNIGAISLIEQQIQASTLADLYQYPVGVLRTPKKLLDATIPNHPRLTMFSSTLALLKGLLGKRIDAAFSTPAELWLHAEELGVDDQLEMIVTTGSLEVLFAWPTTSKNIELRHDFSLALEKLRREGKIANILKKYGHLEHFNNYGAEPSSTLLTQ